MQTTVQVGEQFTNNKTGETYTFHATAASTEGAYVQFDNFVPAGLAGPPTHLHPKQEETFTVLSGTLQVTVNGETRLLTEGETAVIPPQTAHTFDNRHGDDVTFRVTLTPALDSDLFFAGIVQAANKSRSGSMSLRQLAKLIHKQESRFQLVGPPAWLQNWLFNLLAKF